MSQDITPTAGITPARQKAYASFQARKRRAVEELRALADECAVDARRFAVVEARWMELVGEHRDDMQCGMVLHAIHTRDAAQLRESFDLIMGVWKPPQPVRLIECAQCHAACRPGSTLCHKCKKRLNRKLNLILLNRKRKPKDMKGTEE